MQGLRSNSALCLAQVKARASQPILIFSPHLVLGTPENAQVTQQFCSLVCPREGSGEVATVVFLYLRLVLGTPKIQGLHSTFALFWAPEKAGVRHLILIFSTRLAMGTHENAGVA